MSEEEAIRIQEELRLQVIQEDILPEIVQRIAGVDVAYETGGNRLVAAVAVLDAKTFKTLEIATLEAEAEFPYIPGLFSFRELPPLLRVLEKLEVKPDIIVCDGHGIAHPRRFGLACHLGVVTRIPTIGCAKTWLFGRYSEPGLARTERSYLFDKGEIIGSVLRTQDMTQPVYVSTGHKISLDTACKWILRLCDEYRLPETTRAADHAVRVALKNLL